MTVNRWFVRSTLIIGLVLLGLMPAVASAQDATTVSGQVKSSVGGAPLVGAIVSIPSLRLNATTDIGGRYSLAVPACGASASRRPPCRSPSAAQRCSKMSRS